MGIQYSSLREKDEIRLLRLEPGTGSTQVKCSLFHARLGESPTYDALSYMWDLDRGQSNGKTCMLAIDGPRTMEVGENLGNALRHLRLKDRVRVLWVDAICINQADDAERGHQVAQMGMIYSQATTVRIWLGMADACAMQAFQFLRNPETIRRMKVGIVDVEGWEAVATLCKRKYWNRLWIIQEVVLAARIEIHCGERVLPWELFSNALFALEEGLQYWSSAWAPFNAGPIIARVVDSAALKICRQRRANTESGPAKEFASLLSLFWIHKDAKCVDIRDKIFGLHSFAPACCRRNVPVDYQCSAYTLCRRLLEHDTRFHFNERRNGGLDRIVRRSLDLHCLILKGASNQVHSKNSFEVGSPDAEAELLDEAPAYQAPGPIMVLGNELGRVVFVTGPLKSLFVEDGAVVVPRDMVDTFQEMKFGVEERETPMLSNRITKALRQIWRSKEMDIVPSSRPEMAQDLGTVDVHSEKLQDDPAIRGLRTFLTFCCEFLRTSDFLDANPQYEDCLMYLARTGVDAGYGWKIGFAPVGTQLGDSVCTFRETNIIAIVRNIDGDHFMVGQGSTFAPPQSESSPQTGNVLNIQFDLSTLQIFSRFHRPFYLADYRVALSIPPNSITEARGLPNETRRSLERPTAPGYRRQEDSMSSPNESGPGEKGTETSIRSSNTSTSHANKDKLPATKYSCPRCKATFETSRDNLRHAATWSHSQCNKCRRWASWQSTTSITTTTLFCTQCRIEDPGCAGVLPSIQQQAARFSWSTRATTETRDSLLTDSDSDDLSSNATTVWDQESVKSDDTIVEVMRRRRAEMLVRDGPFFFR